MKKIRVQDSFDLVYSQISAFNVLANTNQFSGEIHGGIKIKRIKSKI